MRRAVPHEQIDRVIDMPGEITSLCVYPGLERIALAGANRSVRLMQGHSDLAPIRGDAVRGDHPAILRVGCIPSIFTVLGRAGA